MSGELIGNPYNQGGTKTPYTPGAPTLGPLTQSTVDAAIASALARLVGGGFSSPATTATQGIVKLAGDLGGTADLPTVPGLSVLTASLARDRGTYATRSFLNVKNYGAVGDGVQDDLPAFAAALAAASPGQTIVVPVPPVAYGLSGPIGNGSTGYSNVQLLGLGGGGVRLKSLNNTSVLSGVWTSCSISNLMLDANNKGSVGANVHLDHSNLIDVSVTGWNDKAYSLNDGTWTNNLGLLNHIVRGSIDQSSGTGIFTSYRFSDSWIEGVNIGSTGPNVSLEGGPVRVLGCHLNGQPKYNVELRGNRRVLVANNVMEGSRQESVFYQTPNYVTSNEVAEIVVANNLISNGGKGSAGTYPCIGFRGNSATARALGLTVSGNVISCQDGDAGWSYAVKAAYARYVSLTGNTWWAGHMQAAPVAATDVLSIEVVGNHADNAVVSV